MLAAHAAGSFPLEIARIFLAEKPCPRVLVNGILRREIAKVREGEKAWHIASSISGNGLARPLHRHISCQSVGGGQCRMLRSLARFRAARAALPAQKPHPASFPRNCSKLAEDHCGEAVCGNQVMIFTCIVRRPKTGPSHSGISYGRAKAVVLQRFPRIALFNCPWPDESVRRLLTVLCSVRSMSRIL